MSQYGFYFDSSKCSGCKTCQVSCKETYNLPANNLYRRVYEYQGGSWNKNEAGSYVPDHVFGYKISMACNHCAEPACFANCPVGAIAKDPDTGIVTIDQSTCIGCRTCITACPYEVPTYNEETGLVSKCDFCQGEMALDRKPVCVAACPMRALDCGTMEELEAKYGKGEVEIEPLPKNTTNPSLIINPHKDAQKSGEGTGKVVNLAEEI